MVTTPEHLARQEIDAALTVAGWLVQDAGKVNLFAGRGVAVREFQLTTGPADYLLFVDAQAVGVVEAKPEGTTLTGVERQAERYSGGLPAHVPAPRRPLPFLYQSTGVETRFTNGLDPDPKSRRVFAFHQPATLAGWIGSACPSDGLLAAETASPYHLGTLRTRLRQLPELDPSGLWPAQITAVLNLERSLAEDRPRALIQMATGSGKTFTAITSIYRLIKYGGAQRVLFLVDRANLGKQAATEFQQYTTPDDGRKFTDLYNVQLLSSNRIDPVARVCIGTIQRLYSMLQGQPDLDPALEEGSQFDPAGQLIREPVPVTYNPAIPIETFDVIVIDECHRSIFNLWRQVLEYFDAYLVGLTATPSKQAFGFFHQNLVMEYAHPKAVADGVNVDYTVYRIKTAITEHGATVEAGNWVDRRDRKTRDVRWEQLDEDLTYGASALDRDVVAEDQIRTVIRTFKERLFTEIFPGRTEVPKTLIFAKDDSHAEDIVDIVREEFGRGNQFCRKITYRTTGEKPEQLIRDFRSDYYPRIAVSVDMIATGTDIKPLEIVMFLRAVKSRNYYEQMLGRGVRVINSTDFRAVTPDASQKTHFVVVDCVGVTEQEPVDMPSLERQPGVSLGKLLNVVAYGNSSPDVVSTLAGRLARLDRVLEEPERQALAAVAGIELHALVQGLVAALDPDRHVEEARTRSGLEPDAQPSDAQIEAAAAQLRAAAVRPLAANPALRERLIEARQRGELTVDTVSQDRVLEAGYSAAARERARELTRSFEQYLSDHRDEITALQILYSRPYGRRLRYEDIKALANAIAAPPRTWTPALLWQAYQTLDRDKVRGSGQRLLTDIVALVRYALHQEPELVPYPEQVRARFEAWLAQQEQAGRRFSVEQRQWLDLICDQIAASLGIEREDFEYTPFVEHGGLGKVWEVFGSDLFPLLEELNEVLVA